MAGNTKFIGFGHTKEGMPTDRVFLERWGEKVSVPLSPESISKLREACYHRLPSAPKGKGRGYWVDFNASYDPSGRLDGIDVKLSPAGAKKLHEILGAAAAGAEAAKEDADQSSYPTPDELAEFIKFTRFAGETLLKAMEGRDEVFNVSDEPGVETQ